MPVTGEAGLVAVVQVGLFNWPVIVGVLNVGVVIVCPEAISPPVTCVNAMIYPYAVYVPDELNLIIVLLPEVVTVGLPVVIPE